MHIAPSALESPSRSSRPPDTPGWDPRAGAASRPPRRLAMLLLSIGLVAVVSSVGVVVAANRQVARIQRIPGLASVLSAPSDNVENFLLVGSDSREGIDPNSPDYGGIGNTTDVQGHRSDTIMVLRRDKAGGPASLLSIPRDLWVEIAGTGKKSRINSAYQAGPATLIQTVQTALGIPIHHYVEIDFQGFKSLVDAIGGVQVCFDAPARDEHTGLFIAEPGCYVLDGVQGLAYARSRYYETYINDQWVRDGTSDLGRIKRQQHFINTALQAAVAKVKGNPLHTGDIFAASTGAVRIDDQLDVLATAVLMRGAVASGLVPYSLPVVGKTIGGNAVLLLGPGAQAYLDYFSGVSTTPPAP